jgi:SMC interacting uncharacterized protein involved in chromosome segregation
MAASSNWTLDTLAKFLSEKIEDSETRTKERFELSKLAVDAALAASEKAINAAMAAAEKAVTKAEVAAEKRFDSVNEFRAAMKDQTTSFADKAQTDFRLSVIERKIENYSGQAQGISNIWVFLVGAVTVAVGLSLLLIKVVH